MGLNLKIPADVLESIESQYSDDRRRLGRIILEFLKRIDPKPTWRAIVDALKSPTVNMAKLAERIETKYCSPPKPDTGRGMSVYSLLLNQHNEHIHVDVAQVVWSPILMCVHSMKCVHDGHCIR